MKEEWEELLSWSDGAVNKGASHQTWRPELHP